MKLPPSRVVDPNLLVLFARRQQIAQSAKRRRKPPVWLHPRALEREYAQLLLAYTNDIFTAARQILLPALPALEQEANAGKPRLDDYSDNVNELVTAMSLSVDQKNTRNWSATALDIGQKTSKWNSAQWQKTIRQVTGVNTMQYEPWLQAQLNSFSKENVALISSLKGKALSDIETSTQRALRAGTRHEDISRMIEQQYGTTKARAKLIARDQVSKLNGELTEVRQTSIGISEYIWRTSGDERVRPSHSVMSGKRCRWDDPNAYLSGTAWASRSSIGGVSLHPGRDFQCRCWAEPVFDAVYDAIDAGTYTPGSVTPPPVPKVAPRPLPVVPRVLPTAPPKPPTAPKPPTPPPPPVAQGPYAPTKHTGEKLATYIKRTRLLQHEELGVFEVEGAHKKALWWKSGGAGSINFDHSEATRMSNRVLIHNHPPSTFIDFNGVTQYRDGRSFSGADLRTAVAHHIHEVRVVSSQYTYRFIRTPKTIALPYDDLYVAGGTTKPLDYTMIAQRNQVADQVSKAWNAEYKKNCDLFQKGKMTSADTAHRAAKVIAKKFGFKYTRSEI